MSEATDYAHRFGVTGHQMAHWGADVQSVLNQRREDGKPEPERLEMGRAMYRELLESEPTGNLVRGVEDDYTLYGLPVTIDDMVPYRLARIRTAKSRPETAMPQLVKDLAGILTTWRKTKHHQPTQIEMTEATAEWLALRVFASVGSQPGPGPQATIFGVPVVFNEQLPFGVANPVDRYTDSAKGTA